LPAVKLLFDHNLSPHLRRTLAGSYPGSKHALELHLERASDLDLWELAKTQGYTIVSKDSDFMQLSFLRGAPPKVIWIRAGNSSTAELKRLLSDSVQTIREFMDAPEVAYLILSRSVTK
jgi:predicted nuclease of predicted toxin-antitoxin system